MSVLSSPHFHDEAKAFEYLESIVWADGIVCPHCGVVGGRVYDLSGVRSKASKKSPEGKVRHGLKKCGECRSQFTVRKGTIFEESHLEMHKWLQAIYLMCASKKGISAKQLERMLGVSYKTAWFMSHRIREAMKANGGLPPMGGEGEIVEADETYFGKVVYTGSHENAVIALNQGTVDVAATTAHAEPVRQPLGEPALDAAGRHDHDLTGERVGQGRDQELGEAVGREAPRLAEGAIGGADGARLEPRQPGRVVQLVRQFLAQEGLTAALYGAQHPLVATRDRPAAEGLHDPDHLDGVLLVADQPANEQEAQRPVGPGRLRVSLHIDSRAVDAHHPRGQW